MRGGQLPERERLQLHRARHARGAQPRLHGLLKGLRRTAVNRGGERLDQPPVAVPREPRVAGGGGEAPDRPLAQAHVEYRREHARHRHGRAGAHGDHERAQAITQPHPGVGLQDPERAGCQLADLAHAGTGTHVGAARERRREHNRGRHTQAGPRHARQAVGLGADRVGPRKRALGRSQHVHLVAVGHRPLARHGGGLAATRGRLAAHGAAEHLVAQQQRRVHQRVRGLLERTCHLDQYEQVAGGGRAGDQGGVHGALRVVGPVLEADDLVGGLQEGVHLLARGAALDVGGQRHGAQVRPRGGEHHRAHPAQLRGDLRAGARRTQEGEVEGGVLEAVGDVVGGLHQRQQHAGLLGALHVGAHARDDLIGLVLPDASAPCVVAVAPRAGAGEGPLELVACRLADLHHQLAVARDQLEQLLARGVHVAARARLAPRPGSAASLARRADRRSRSAARSAGRHARRPHPARRSATRPRRRAVRPVPARRAPGARPRRAGRPCGRGGARPPRPAAPQRAALPTRPRSRLRARFQSIMKTSCEARPVRKRSSAAVSAATTRPSARWKRPPSMLGSARERVSSQATPRRSSSSWKKISRARCTSV